MLRKSVVREIVQEAMEDANYYDIVLEETLLDKLSDVIDIRNDEESEDDGA